MSFSFNDDEASDLYEYCMKIAADTTAKHRAILGEQYPDYKIYEDSYDLIIPEKEINTLEK